MPRWAGLLLLLLAAPPARAASPQAAPSDDLLVVLTETGSEREGLPVYARHPDPERHLAVLTRGFSGRLLRLYRLEQRFLAARDGRPIEPAYLLLSTTQGGFPRFGFWLGDERKDGVGYVDLHRNSDLSGRFGAMDQIFPHELTHVIVRQLAGEPPEGGTNQVHAIAVTTDRVTAFNEGFAEHVQVMAVDDADAVPETARLAEDPGPLTRAERRLAGYRRALEATWAPAPAARMAFVLWFGQTEQALRYHAVKANGFSRAPAIPPRMLRRSDRYPAYLLDNTLPGSPEDPVKPAARLFASEGFVSSLFWRWSTSDRLRRRYREPAFYEALGTTADAVDPLDNVYLKLFAVVASAHPHDAPSLVDAYVKAFPDEADAVEAVLVASGAGWPLVMPVEIWVANDGFQTGTTLYDQFRALPRRHTFDVNAASLVDLLTVQRMTRATAEAILRSAPFGSLDELRAVPGMTPELSARFETMADNMSKMLAGELEEDVSLNLTSLVTPYLYRAGAWILLCALASALLYRSVRRLRWLRLVLNGLGAATVGLLVTWVLAPGPWAALLPLALFGLPGATWQLVGTRRGAGPARVLAAWAVACLPALVVTQPLG